MWFAFPHVEINRDHFFIIDFQAGLGKYMDPFLQLWFLFNKERGFITKVKLATFSYIKNMFA